MNTVNQLSPVRQSTRDKYAGIKYGALTVLDITRRDPKNTHHHFAKVRCDCGIEKEVRLSGLQGGGVVSCGCVGKASRAKANNGNTRARKKFGENAKNTLYKNYIRYATERGLAFSLTLDQFIGITEQPCYYCGLPPSNIKKPSHSYGHHVYNGVDRVDNEIGYTTDNCVPACRPCNAAKNAVTKEMVFKLYHRLFPHTTLSRKHDVSQGLEDRGL